jgi:hypothetical protein
LDRSCMSSGPLRRCWPPRAPSGPAPYRRRRSPRGRSR